MITPPLPPHPLEPWLLASFATSNCDAFDTVTVTRWLLGSCRTSDRVWLSYHAVASDLLRHMVRRGALARDENGFCRPVQASPHVNSQETP